jgi:hypothetical protein
MRCYISVETTAGLTFGSGLGSCRLSDSCINHPHDFVQSHDKRGGRRECFDPVSDQVMETVVCHWLSADSFSYHWPRIISSTSTCSHVLSPAGSPWSPSVFRARQHPLDLAMPTSSRSATVLDSGLVVKGVRGPPGLRKTTTPVPSSGWRS